MRKKPKPVTKAEERRIVQLRDCKAHHSFNCIGKQLGRHSATVHKIYMRVKAETSGSSRQKIGTTHTTVASGRAKPRAPAPMTGSEAETIHALRTRHNMSWGNIAKTMDRSTSVCRRAYVRAEMLKEAERLGEKAASVPAHIPEHRPGAFSRFIGWIFS